MGYLKQNFVILALYSLFSVMGGLQGSNVTNSAPPVTRLYLRSECCNVAHESFTCTHPLPNNGWSGRKNSFSRPKRWSEMINRIIDFYKSANCIRTLPRTW